METIDERETHTQKRTKTEKNKGDKSVVKG